MAIHCLYSTIFLEEQFAEHSPESDIPESVLSVLNNPRSILETADKVGDVVDQAIISMVKHAGFDDIEENAKKRLRQLFIMKTENMAKQFVFAQQRKKTHKFIPYPSPLVWILTLNDPHDVLKLKEWYDETYKNRFENIKTKWNQLIKAKKNGSTESSKDSKLKSENE